MATNKGKPASTVGRIISTGMPLEYRWEIPNYLWECQRVGDGKKIISPEFSIGNICTDTWNLELFPNGHELLVDKKWMAVLLSTDCESMTNFLFQFSLFGGNKQEIFKSPAWFCGGIYVAALCETSELLLLADEILDDGKLMIVYKADVVRDHHNAPLSNSCRHRHRLRQLDKYENILDEEEYSDLSFVVEGKTIFAHKLIMASGSPVFAAMMKHHAMRESTSNSVVIEDAEYDVFKELLRFIYCGKVRDVDAIADNLLVLAEKYEVLELKEICEHSLRHHLSAENVVDRLKLADLHRAKELSNAAIGFVVARAEEVIKRPNFDDIFSLDNKICSDIMRGLVARLPPAK